MQINVLDYFEATASRLGEKAAVVDRGAAVTFGQLRGEAMNLAARLVAACDCINRPVAVFLPKSKDAVASARQPTV